MARRRGIQEYPDLEVVDYEYQSFTPNLILVNDGTLNGSTVNFAIYTQIGDLVHGYFRIGVDVTGPTSAITGFRIDAPVPIYSYPAAAFFGGGYWYNGSVAFEVGCLWTSGAPTQIQLFSMPYSEIFNAGTRNIWGNFTYRAA